LSYRIQNQFNIPEIEPKPAKNVSVANPNRDIRGSRVGAQQRRASDWSLDVKISSTLHRRMIELGLAPIAGAVVTEHEKPTRAPLLNQPLATNIIQ